MTIDPQIHADPFSFVLIDYALLAAGILTVATIAVTLYLRRTGRNALQLPPPPANRLDAVDLFAGLLLIIALPSLVAQLLALSSPAGDPPPQDHTNDATWPQVLGITISQSIAIIALVALGRRRFIGGLSAWGLTCRAIHWRLLQAFIAVLVAIPVCFALLEASRSILQFLQVDYREHAAIVALLDSTKPAAFRALVVINALVLASIGEELVFRGLLQPALSQWARRPWAALVVTSILFGLIHFPYPDTIAPLIAFGMILGYLYAKTGSLTLVILVHALFNGKTLLWLLLGAR